MKLNQIQFHINLLIHQEVCANSNTSYPPQRGMQPLGIETISCTLKHLTILNFFKFSFTLSTPWQLAQWNCILFHSTTNLHAKYFNLHYLHGHFIVASSIFQPRAYNRKTFLLQWQKENCYQLSHQTPWNLWLNTC